MKDIINAIADSAKIKIEYTDNTLKTPRDF